MKRRYNFSLPGGCSSEARRNAIRTSRRSMASSVVLGYSQEPENQALLRLGE